MTLKDFLDNPEEIFIGAALQFPLYFIVGWWVAPVMLLCGVLWRLGGTAGGSKLFRRIGVPLVVCSMTFFSLHDWQIFLAIPFMVWLCPAAYGKDSWLYKWILGIVKNEKKADLIVRGILFVWYWSAFGIALMF